jgi:hypothetical protein
MDWNERREQWDRFRAWEAARLRERPADYSAAVAWMSEAWAFARHADPEWGSQRRREEHIDHIGIIRARLAHLRATR